MKKSHALALLAVLALFSAIPASAGDNGPLEIVQSAYVDGIHRNADADAMRAGFHEKFMMYVNADEGMMTISRDDWAARIEKTGADPDRTIYEISADLEIVGKSANAAVVKVKLSRDGKHVFTDFLSLYKTSDGWKIVAKIYTAHK